MKSVLSWKAQQVGTNHNMKVYAKGLEASRYVFYIIHNHGKGIKTRIVGEDLVFTEKEAT